MKLLKAIKGLFKKQPKYATIVEYVDSSPKAPVDYNYGRTSTLVFDSSVPPEIEKEIGEEYGEDKMFREAFAEDK